MFAPESSSVSREPEPLEPEPSATAGDAASLDASSVIPQEEKVPSFIGETITAVEGNANYQSLFEFTKVEEFNDDFPEGYIFAQTPEENTPIGEGKTPVTLSVSKGPQMAVMPDVVGSSFNDALRVLGEQNLACDRMDRYVPDAAPGSVVSTTPPAGETFNPKEQKITLYVMPQEPGLPPEATDESPPRGQDPGIDLSPFPDS
jgi:serine/threonine-protein kinase